MSDILAGIIARKREEVCDFFRTAQGEIVRLGDGANPGEIAAVAPPSLDFADALRNAAVRGRLPVVAEIKRKSPSAGILRQGQYQPENIARQYAQAGAACLSVLTDAQFFGGENAHLAQARDAAKIPALRKDFIVDPRQIPESRLLGADAVLLILAALPDDSQVRHLADAAQEFGMAVVAEVHDRAEMHRALKIPQALVGVNNRNLRDFHVSLETTVRLAPVAKDAGKFVIAESGIDSAESIMRLRDAGADAFLVGGALMKSPDPGDALRALFADYSSSAIQP